LSIPKHISTLIRLSGQEKEEQERQEAQEAQEEEEIQVFDSHQTSGSFFRV
jgi:hypothetical protein